MQCAPTKKGHASVFLLMLLAMLCLGGCALLRPVEPELLPPLLHIAPSLLGERTVEQRLVIRWPGGERSMEAVLEIAGDRLQLVALTFGMRLMSLEYDGVTVRAERALPMLPSGERMTNDLLMIAAPLDTLRRALPENWRVTESKNEQQNTLRREIAQGDEIWGVIDYASDTASPWQGRVEFTHTEGYQLILDSHEL
ncbi:MAG: DUF3261 domain-containing protein [Zoogloeaceae bacterium]|jgi:hypothetical protein|nr:DUF3261 domain-containing protein [Zoogloeaceae bacterium]